jgi:hypothetical protein
MTPHSLIHIYWHFEGSAANICKVEEISQIVSKLGVGILKAGPALIVAYPFPTKKQIMAELVMFHVQKK